MNLTRILAFHRVASAGSFTLAARMNGVSQPTLSAQVRALELSAGGALFERSRRRIRLTPLGEKVFEATQRLAGAMDEVERALAGQQGVGAGRLRVAADSAIHVLPVLAELRKRSPELEFSLRIDNSASIIAQVLNEEADVGVMARPTADVRLASVKIREDRLVLLVAADDPLARRRQARWTDIAGRELVIREKGSITREVAEAELKRAKVKAVRVFDVATREAVQEAVAAGFGIGIVFASEVSRDPRLRPLPIADANPGVAEYAICRAERRGLRLIARFLEAAQRVAGAMHWLEHAPPKSARPLRQRQRALNRGR